MLFSRLQKRINFDVWTWNNQFKINFFQQVCQFQHCGIQLRDGDQLEWHYQGHIAQEMQKLKKLRIKKSQIDQVNELNSNSLENAILEIQMVLNLKKLRMYFQISKTKRIKK